MDFATARSIESALSRPASANVPATVAPKTGRLAGAVRVMPVEPVPAPVTSRRSRSAAPAPVVAPPPTVVRIRRDPAVVAAEAERKLQAKAAADAEIQRLAGIEAERKAEDARAAAAEAKAEVDRAAERKVADERARQVEADRKAAEAAERELATVRAEFLNFVARADDEAFPYAWSSVRREWIVENAAIADIGWIRARRVELETGIARLLASLAPYRAGLIERLEMCDHEVITEMSKGRSWRSREDWLRLARNSASQRHLNLLIDAEQLASRIIGDRQREERERLAKPAAVDTVKTLATALGQKQGFGGAQVQTSGKKPTLSILEQLRVTAAQPVVPVGYRPSKAELAALDRKLNPAKELEPYRPKPSKARGGSHGTVTPTEPASVAVQAMACKPLSMRITALADSPKIVTNVYRGKVTRWRWETVEAMLAVPASDKEANIGLAEFVGRCEKAKRNGR